MAMCFVYILLNHKLFRQIEIQLCTEFSITKKQVFFCKNKFFRNFRHLNTVSIAVIIQYLFGQQYNRGWLKSRVAISSLRSPSA